LQLQQDPRRAIGNASTETIEGHPEAAQATELVEERPADASERIIIGECRAS